MSILLSEKYGVNPSMNTCFYCGETTGIALMGKLPGDKEAPRYCCSSVTPCEKCAEKYKDYVLIVEMPDCENSTPTGRWFALKKDILKSEFRKSPVAFMLDYEFQQILNSMEAKHE